MLVDAVPAIPCTVDPGVTKPCALHAEPTRRYVRMLKLDPKCMKSRTDVCLPNRAKLRSDRQLDIWMAPCTEIMLFVVPTMHPWIFSCMIGPTPKTDKPPLTRMNPRTESIDPMWPKSSVESCEPSLVCDLKLIDEPQCAKSNADSELPSRAKLLKDSADPK
jgi:hypothetical protein